jgi:glycolate oxidase FAD binding subunit
MASDLLQSVEDVRQAVASFDRVRVRGGGSKPALSAPPVDAGTIDLTALAGIVEYDPREYTLSARAGTRVRDVQAALSEHGQALPFDPPFAERGATLGGTVASGLSGPGRQRNGGLRDFILGVTFVDGQARVVRGGGKVVKNAAGFDLPKLFVGSLGRLGVLVEMTFKVFPRSPAYGTLRRSVGNAVEGLAVLRRLSRSAWDLAALDFVVAAPGRMYVDVRLGGLTSALNDRLAALRGELGGGEVLVEQEDEQTWRAAREFEWVAAGGVLAKVPVTPERIAGIEGALPAGCGMRRYSAAGQVAWVDWRDGVDSLDSWLRGADLGGLVISGTTAVASPLVGVIESGPFAERVKQAIDPTNRFG